MEISEARIRQPAQPRPFFFSSALENFPEGGLRGLEKGLSTYNVACLEGRRRTEEVRACPVGCSVHGDSRPGDNSFGLVDTAVGLRSLH
jgi:hypothetical protein